MKKNFDENCTEDTKGKPQPTSRSNRHSKYKSRGDKIGRNFNDTRKFALDHGMTKEQLDIVKQKLGNGEISQGSDYSYLTKEKMLSDDFDTEATMKQMMEDYKNSMNIRIGISGITGFKHG